MLEKVISGAQTGADLAGLDTALKFGLKTGGWMTKGFRTLDGNKPAYKAKYGITEHSSFYYKDRTWFNIRDSKGTIRFAHDFSSAGEKCTFGGIKAYGRPYIDIDLGAKGKLTPDVVASWIELNNIGVLNVAGNSEQTAPGIYVEVCEYLEKVFKILGFKEISS